jgi:exosortase
VPPVHHPDRTDAVATAPPRAAVTWLVVFLAALAWVFWPSFVTLLSRWSRDPQYTHGYVVPLFAALVLYLRRDRFPGFKPSYDGVGVALLVIAVIARLAASLFAFDWLEHGSFLPAVVGVVWLTCGPRVARWAWPAAVLLLFILPWPWQVDQWLTYPLRRLATVCSTFALQTLGVPALARGNIIVVNDLEVGVVEACSGLGMLMTFFALSTAVAFAVKRPPLDKALIFLSAVPIALVMNVLRITVTVFLYQYASAEFARVVFHDVAGWVMMPMALLALWLLIRLLDASWLPPEDGRPVPIANPGGRGANSRPMNALKSRPEAPAAPSMQEITDAAQ